VRTHAWGSAISTPRETAAWFAAHILPHEADVRGWLRASLRIDNADDVIQEAYAKMFAQGGLDQVVSGRAWFFAVARNIVLKQMRRDRIVRIEAVAEIDALGIVDYEPSAERAVSGRQELARVQRLIEALPERCRLIFQMRKIDGLPQREIAERLRVSENVVEKEAAKGLRLVLQGLGEEAGAGRRPLRLFARKARHARQTDRR
jgi:RNA polymerase sigma factor (sigma-70 family)